jgi:hypothetical protein
MISGPRFVSDAFSRGQSCRILISSSGPRRLTDGVLKCRLENHSAGLTKGVDYSEEYTSPLGRNNDGEFTYSTYRNSMDNTFMDRASNHVGELFTSNAPLIMTDGSVVTKFTMFDNPIMPVGRVYYTDMTLFLGRP